MMDVKTEVKVTYTDVMLDVETLGNEGKFVVLQIAMVPFNIGTYEICKMDECFNCTINAKEQIEKGFKTGGETVDWWLKTNTDLLCSLLNPDEYNYSVYAACSAMKNFIDCFKPERFWATATLDYQAISNLCESAGRPNPVEYNKRFCARTIRMLAEKGGYEHQYKNSHNAYEDCVNQINDLKEQIPFIYGNFKPEKSVI